MALPDSWLDHLFGKLAVRYGDAWFRKWDGIPMVAVRADWAQVLDGLSGDAIGHGLQYLPADFPPTAAAFRALCNARPIGQPMLPQPKHVNGPGALAAIERMQRTRAEIVGRKPPPDSDAVRQGDAP
jgi:hypothetical protein